MRDGSSQLIGRQRYESVCEAFKRVNTNVGIAALKMTSSTKIAETVDIYIFKTLKASYFQAVLGTFFWSALFFFSLIFLLASTFSRNGPFSKTGYC